jgi:hypothetical protein
MKRRIEMMGILLMLFLAGSGYLFAQRGMRGMMQDSARMDRMMRERIMRMPLMLHNPDSMQMHGIKPGMGPLWMNPGGRGWWQMPMYRMRRGFVPGPMYGMRRGMGQVWLEQPWRHGMRMDRPLLDRIPDLTEKQKKEIAGLRQKQQDEMKKQREEMSAKIKNLRESHRAKIMNLLTDEQKKWLEENTTY